jgi:IS605 OrfB family transposase
MTTFGARVFVSTADHEALMDLSEQLAHARHALFKRWKVQGENLGEAKRAIVARHRLSSRQFNGIRFDVQQAVATWTGTQQFLKENAADRVAGLKDKLTQTTQAIQTQTTVWKSLATRRRRAASQAQNARETLALAKVGDPAKTGRAGKQGEPEKLGKPVKLKVKVKLPASSVLQLNASWKEARVKLDRLRTKRHRLLMAIQKQEAAVARFDRILTGKPRVCFGGKNLLAKANRKLETARQDLAAEWLPEASPLSVARRAKLHSQSEEARAAIEAWKVSRRSGFTYVGSKDESSGNASARYDPQAHTLALALLPLPGATALPRVVLNLGPKAFARNHGQRVLQTTLATAQAHQTGLAEQAKAQRLAKKALAVAAAHASADEAADAMMADPAANGSDDLAAGVANLGAEVAGHGGIARKLKAGEAAGALTWKLWPTPEHDDPVKGTAWAVRVTVQIPSTPVPTRTFRQAGAIGIDLNANHLACTQVDRFGNFTRSWNLPFPDGRAGLTAGQIRAHVEEAAVRLCREAVKSGVPIVIEDLDFRRKKASLKALGASMAQMLSGLAYRLFETALAARAAKDGVELIRVNPAFTSVIGRLKFQRHYQKLSIHQAAAGVIARRGLNFTERVARPLILVHPVRNWPRSQLSRWRHVTVCDSGALQNVNERGPLASAFARGNPRACVS